MASPRPPKLTFRVESESGDVLVRPRLCPGNALTGQRYLVLLIHGFNNTQKQAEEAYDGFLALQRELGDLNPGQQVADGHIVEFYWPGDVGWWEWSRAKNYDDSLERAIEIARRLVQAFERLIRDGVEKEIDIVAHSMGCRLTLELINQLHAMPGVRVRRVVFMAAAVPTFMLELGKRLQNGLNLSRTEGILSLFSLDDNVLDIPFRLGQWDASRQRWARAGEESNPNGDTIALGREHWNYRNLPTMLRQAQISGAGHSDYWGWKPGTRDNHGKRANHEVKQFLRFTAAGARETSARDTAEREAAPARAGSPERDTASRTVEEAPQGPCAEV